MVYSLVYPDFKTILIYTEYEHFMKEGQSADCYIHILSLFSLLLFCSDSSLLLCSRCDGVYGVLSVVQTTWNCMLLYCMHVQHILASRVVEGRRESCVNSNLSYCNFMLTLSSSRLGDLKLRAHSL